MRIHADRDRCASSGMCVLTVPEVFEQDDADGRVVLLDPTPAAELDQRLRQAVMLCPSHALSLTEND
jgi:ferredoxin